MRTLTLPTLPSMHQFVTTLFQHNTSRLLQYDALRGIALLIMLLDHSELQLHAEYNMGSLFEFTGWLNFWLGIATNVATPTFWVLAGVSIALFAQARRRKDTPEWHITRFLFMRGAILLLLEFVVLGQIFFYRFDILSSLGIAIMLMSVLRLMPRLVLTGLMATILLSYQVIVPLTWDIALTQSYPVWVGFWLYSISLSQTGDIYFPVLGWLPLMGFGFVLGHYVYNDVFKQARTWLGIGAGLLLTWFLIRGVGEYGNFISPTFTDNWYAFLVMSKGPPSLAYLTFNLALATLLMAVLVAYPGLQTRFPIRYIIVYGQVSLFFFVVHKFLIRRVDYLFGGLMNVPSENLFRGLSVWVITAVALLLMSAVYRYIRLQYPKSILRFF